MSQNQPWLNIFHNQMLYASCSMHDEDDVPKFNLEELPSGLYVFLGQS